MLGFKERDFPSFWRWGKNMKQRTLQWCYAFCVKKHMQKGILLQHIELTWSVSLSRVITTADFLFFNASFSFDSSRLRKLEAVSSKGRFCLAEFQAIFWNTFICCFLQHYKYIFNKSISKWAISVYYMTYLVPKSKDWIKIIIRHTVKTVSFMLHFEYKWIFEYN